MCYCRTGFHVALSTLGDYKTRVNIHSNIFELNLKHDDSEKNSLEGKLKNFLWNVYLCNKRISVSNSNIGYLISITSYQ